ncbi:MAG TPA: condensation domain-containing protein, partial [Ktedonobacteraceae bacterium]|nr:condensation domain-containing protein [Ktedonobacteraceae bacterium]
SLLVNLFSHGREGLFEDMDVSRTVGTFGTDFPVLITLASTLSLEEALYQVKAQLAQVPNHGIGYGILRHLSQSEQAMRLRAMPEAEIVVNYIGETFNDPRQPRFQIFGPYTGHHHDQETDRGYKLQVTGQVFEEKLQLRWDYSENLHHHATIEALARQTIEFIRSILVLQPGSPVGDERKFIS